MNTNNTQKQNSLFTLISQISLFALLLIASGCNGGGGGGGNGGGGGGGGGGGVDLGGDEEVVAPPEEESPADNKGAEFSLITAPSGLTKYKVILTIENLIPGTKVKQENAQAILFGEVGNAGVYTREHFTYDAGSGKVSLVVTLTDPNDQVLLKNLEVDIPNGFQNEIQAP